jgi:hypothetical protein
MFEALGIFLGLSIGFSIAAFFFFLLVYDTRKNEPEEALWEAFKAGWEAANGAISDRQRVDGTDDWERHLSGDPSPSQSAYQRDTERHQTD